MTLTKILAFMKLYKNMQIILIIFNIFFRLCQYNLHESNSFFPYSTFLILYGNGYSFNLFYYRKQTNISMTYNQSTFDFSSPENNVIQTCVIECFVILRFVM